MNQIKKCLLIIPMSVLLLATGCSSAIDLTTEQNDMIANYAAHLVVNATKKDFSYTPDIKDVNSESGASEETTELETNSDGTPVVDVNEEAREQRIYESLAEYLGMPEMTISYKNYALCNEYPLNDDAIFVLPADEGHNLVVVEYDIYNPGTEDYVYTTPEDLPIFRLSISDSLKIRSFKNILMNDFANMNRFTIPAMSSETAIIVFQVEAEDVADMMNIQIEYRSDGQYISLPVENR